MKLRKIKLSDLSDAGLKDKELNALKGGNCCRCSCYWEGKGGASWDDNMMANHALDTESKNGCNQYAACEDWPLDVDPDWLHE